MSGTVVAKLADLEEAVPVKVYVEGEPVVVVRIGDEVYALADTCSHAEASLSEGDVYEDDAEIECPLHGSTFDLRSGEPTCLPATRPVAVYEVVVVGDEVSVESV